MKLRKVGIIGTGHVGSHVAFSLALQGEVDELYMMDIDEKKAKAQAMDINDAVSYIPHKVTATAGPIEDCGDCDILVFSAGPLPNLYQDRKLVVTMYWLVKAPQSSALLVQQQN